MYHLDDILWGKGIMDVAKRVVADTEWDQREGKKADTESVGLEASIHADPTQTGGPEVARGALTAAAWKGA